jgi:hypothetical protein
VPGARPAGQASATFELSARQAVRIEEGVPLQVSETSQAVDATEDRHARQVELGTALVPLLDLPDHRIALAMRRWADHLEGPTPRPAPCN